MYGIDNLPPVEVCRDCNNKFPPLSSDGVRISLSGRCMSCDRKVLRERKDHLPKFKTMEGEEIDRLRARIAELEAERAELAKVWDNQQMVDWIIRAFWRRIYPSLGKMPKSKELPEEIPVQMRWAMSTALMLLERSTAEAQAREGE